MNGERQDLSVRVYIIMLSLSMCSFVFHEGFGMLAELTAWLLLTIWPDHFHVTGSLPGVISHFVIREGSGIFADLPA